MTQPLATKERADMSDTVQKLEIVKQARALERLMGRRRKVVKVLTALDDEIRTSRKLLRDLTAQDPSEAYKPAEGESV